MNQSSIHQDTFDSFQSLFNPPDYIFKIYNIKELANSVDVTNTVLYSSDNEATTKNNQLCFTEL